MHGNAHQAAALGPQHGHPSDQDQQEARDRHGIPPPTGAGVETGVAGQGVDFASLEQLLSGEIASPI